MISDDAPVMLLDSEEDVVRHRKTMGTGTTAEYCNKKRCAKGGRIIDRLHELMNNKENWRHLESKNEYLYPGTFSNISPQHVVFIPDIDKIKPKGSGAAEDFIWRESNFQRVKPTYLEI